MALKITQDKSKQKELQKKFSSQKKTDAQLKAVTGETITDLIEKEEFPLSKDVNWEDVSALPIFNEYDFSPIKQLIKQYHNCQELLNQEMDKESPSTRVLLDINTMMFRINQSLTPYRYSKVELVTIENPNAPTIKIEVENLRVEKNEVIDITP